MSITRNQSSDGNTITLEVFGQFIYCKRTEFKEATFINDLSGMTYHINLSAVNQIDSVALGMLQRLKERTESQGGEVIIVRPSKYILDVLKMFKLDQTFTIEM